MNYWRNHTHSLRCVSFAADCSMLKGWLASSAYSCTYAYFSIRLLPILCQSVTDIYKIKWLGCVLRARVGWVSSFFRCIPRHFLIEIIFNLFVHPNSKCFFLRSNSYNTIFFILHFTVSVSSSRKLSNLHRRIETISFLCSFCVFPFLIIIPIARCEKL